MLLWEVYEPSSGVLFPRASGICKGSRKEIVDKNEKRAKK